MFVFGSSSAAGPQIRFTGVSGLKSLSGLTHACSTTTAAATAKRPIVDDQAAAAACTTPGLYELPLLELTRITFKLPVSDRARLATVCKRFADAAALATTTVQKGHLVSTASLDLWLKHLEELHLQLGAPTGLEFNLYFASSLRSVVLHRAFPQLGPESLTTLQLLDLPARCIPTEVVLALGHLTSLQELRLTSDTELLRFGARITFPDSQPSVLAGMPHLQELQLAHVDWKTADLLTALPTTLTKLTLDSVQLVG